MRCKVFRVLFILSEMKMEHILENVVYFKLLRRGYDVAVERLLIALDCDLTQTKNGIKIMKALGFLCKMGMCGYKFFYLL